MDRTHQILANLIISVILFAAIFYVTGTEDIMNVLAGAKIEYLLLAILLYLALNVSMSFRIKEVLESIGDKLRLTDIIPSNLAGMLASDFTPARAGYFFTAFSLSSKFRIEKEKTILSIFGPQLFDFLIKAISASIIVFLIASSLEINNWVLNSFFLLGVFGVLAFASLLVFYPPFLGKISFMKRIPFVCSGFRFLEKMHLHSDKVLRIKWKIIALTFISWALKAAEWLCLAKAVGIDITGNILQDFLFMLIFQGAITLLHFIPIPTLAGAGASEAGFGTVLVVFGVSLQAAIAFALLTRIIMIMIDVFAFPVILQYLQKHDLEDLLDKVMKMH